VTDALPSFFTRLWLAIVCAFRVVFDASLAARVQRALAGGAETSELPPALAVTKPAATKSEPPPASVPNHDSALALLSLFQREGRLVDFLMQEIESFKDADIGAATRVVHSGCRKSLLGHFDVVRIRTEAEGSSVVVPEGFDGQSVKLVGNVRGTAPYRGVLRHGGWRANGVRLPEKVAGYDASIIVPAEVEL
jgi:hypothetical protein